MTYPSVPFPPAVPRPPRRLVAVAAALLALTAVLAPVAGWLVYTRVVLTDPGIAMCRALRQEAARSSDSAEDFTFSHYTQWRAAIGRSRHDDIRQAGTRLADVVWQFTQAGRARSLAPDDVDRLLSSMADVQGACAEHGVVITIDWTE